MKFNPISSLPLKWLLRTLSNKLLLHYAEYTLMFTINIKQWTQVWVHTLYRAHRHASCLDNSDTESITWQTFLLIHWDERFPSGRGQTPLVCSVYRQQLDSEEKDLIREFQWGQIKFWKFKAGLQVGWKCKRKQKHKFLHWTTWNANASTITVSAL